MSAFINRLRAQWNRDKFTCVGLDSDFSRLPQTLLASHPRLHPQLAFNQQILAATSDIAAAYKPNSAFYEAAGPTGVANLQVTTALIREGVPEALIVVDYKRADIGSTNKGYVDFGLNWLLADAVTVHPYLGMEAMKPFLDQGDMGVIVLCRTSNKGAGEFQDRTVGITDAEAAVWGLPRGTTMPFYELVAYRVSREWNYNGNCALVVGATYPKELARVRAIVGDMPLLIPGVDAQGGDLEASVKAGMDSRGQGFLVNSSRGIIFASSEDDFAEAARRETLRLHEAINRYRAGHAA